MSLREPYLDRKRCVATANPALAGVERVREAGSETAGYVCLDRNERLQPLPDWFLAAVRESVQSSLFTSYPVQDELRHELATRVGLREGQILLTAGSDAAIKALYHAYVRPGDTVVMLEPSYAMYSVYAQIFEARASKVAFDASLELDEKQLLSSVVRGVRLVMIANPNQPTGTLLSERIVLQLAERATAVGALLAVDEAYYPFSRTTVLPWVKRIPHLVVMRSFSKAAGLAGLRIGFVAGDEDIVVNLYKVRSAYDVNSMAVACAVQLLRHPQVVDDYVSQVEAGRALLAERVQALGLIPLPSNTNFMLIRVAHGFPPAQLVANLFAHHYLVKGPSDASCIADCIRVTLGPPAIMSRFADVLQQAISDIGAERQP